MNRETAENLWKAYNAINTGSGEAQAFDSVAGSMREALSEEVPQINNEGEGAISNDDRADEENRTENEVDVGNEEENSNFELRLSAIETRITAAINNGDLNLAKELWNAKINLYKNFNKQLPVEEQLHYDDMSKSVLEKQDKIKSEIEKLKSQIEALKEELNSNNLSPEKKKELENDISKLLALLENYQKELSELSGMILHNPEETQERQAEKQNGNPIVSSTQVSQGQLEANGTIPEVSSIPRTRVSADRVIIPEAEHSQQEVSSREARDEMNENVWSGKDANGTYFIQLRNDLKDLPFQRIRMPSKYSVSGSWTKKKSKYCHAIVNTDTNRLEYIEEDFDKIDKEKYSAKNLAEMMKEAKEKMKTIYGNDISTYMELTKGILSSKDCENLFRTKPEDIVPDDKKARQKLYCALKEIQDIEDQNGNKIPGTGNPLNYMLIVQSVNNIDKRKDVQFYMNLGKGMDRVNQESTNRKQQVPVHKTEEMEQPAAEVQPEIKQQLRGEVEQLKNEPPQVPVFERRKIGGDREEIRQENIDAANKFGVPPERIQASQEELEESKRRINEARDHNISKIKNEIMTLEGRLNSPGIKPKEREKIQKQIESKNKELDRLNGEKDYTVERN